MGRQRLTEHMCKIFRVYINELLVFFFCVEDAVDGGGPQPLGAIGVERGVVPGLDHRTAGLDFAGARLGYVLAVRGDVEHIAGFL